LLASGVGALAFTAQSCVETLELQSTKYTRAQTKRRSYIICTHWWAKINKVSAQASVCIEYGETMMKKGLWGKQEEKRDEAEVERQWTRKKRENVASKEHQECGKEKLVNRSSK